MTGNSAFPVTDRTRVTRAPSNARYERELVYAILDAGFSCHVGYVRDGAPYVTPTAYWRDGNELYWHGSSASPMLRVLAQGIEACVTVTHVDGIVLARSAYHHSMNYRSVMAFGMAQVITGNDAKHAALSAFAEWILPGRWRDVRPPTTQELKATVVMRMDLNAVSAKVRSGAPVDEAHDYALPTWAGVVPFTNAPGTPEPDPRLAPGIATPPALRERVRGGVRG